MANRFLWPPLAFYQINDEHIYNHQKRKKNKIQWGSSDAYCTMPTTGPPHLYLVYMWEVYLRCMGDVIMSSRTAPFFLGTVGIGTQGNPMGSTCVERSKIGFLSFHRTHVIFRVSCILHSKVLCGAFLKAPLFFKASGNPIRFDLTVPVA